MVDVRCIMCLSLASWRFRSLRSRNGAHSRMRGKGKQGRRAVKCRCWKPFLAALVSPFYPHGAPPFRRRQKAEPPPKTHDVANNGNRAVAPNGAMVGTVPTANQYEPSSFDRASHLGVSESMFVNLKKMAKQTYIYRAE